MAAPELARLRAESMVIFRLGLKANSVGVHSTLNRPPKGKGWVQCRNSPPGIMCRPEKVREAIEHFKKAYEILPDIVALNLIALGYEMIGETEMARQYFTLMQEQAEREAKAPYVQAAKLGLGRIGS